MSQIGVQLIDSSCMPWPNTGESWRVSTPAIGPEIDKVDTRVVRVRTFCRMCCQIRGGRQGCPMALQQGKIYRSLPRNARPVRRPGYGGNALVPGEVLRCASPPTSPATKAELGRTHADPGVEDPQGEKDLRRSRLPQRLRKDQLCDADPALPGGWKVQLAGDDIAWIKLDANEALRATNPEAGFFGVAPGTSVKTNPNAMTTLGYNSILPTVALTLEGGIWWSA